MYFSAANSIIILSRLQHPFVGVFVTSENSALKRHQFTLAGPEIPAFDSEEAQQTSPRLNSVNIMA